MLHTEPSFSVYADEDGGFLEVKPGSGEFSFAKDMNDEDDRFSGFDNLGIVQKEEIEAVDAHLLQSNGDLNGAEEYYLRAIQADPEDGESLMQYAKLVWELHRDQDRASGYFESAVRAAPHDCDVLAAYASFLWEIDEDEENDEATTPVEEPFGVDVVGVGSSSSSSNLEEYYKRMVNKNCCDPLFLSNYARFLRQTKGDVEGAEEYYSRAVEADSGDGKVISEYAGLVWELHHDQDKASGYFERAVAASPADSHVLAAYAKFLWEAEDED